MWKEAEVVQLEILSQHLSEEADENLTQNSCISGQDPSFKSPEH
jgi:hypothetical protein